MSSPTTLDNLYNSYIKETQDSRSNKLDFIKSLNLLLFRMVLTKPAEMVTRIFYLKDFYDYKLPTAGFRSAIGVYCDSVQVIRYVSPQRFRWGDPACAFTDQGDNGKRYLRVRNPQTTSIVTSVTECDSLTADGTWSISGGSSLAIDEITKKSGSGSLTFSVSSADAILTFTKSTPIDTSEYTEFLRERFYAWFPGASYLPSSIKIRIGNDASNYFEQTVTTQASGLLFESGFANEIEFSLEDATETGSVNRSAMDWFQFEFVFAASVTRGGFRIDKIMIGKPEIMDFEWYTNYIAYDSSGTLIQSITESTETTDEPIIKDYPEYINTALDGLIYEFLKIQDPTRAQSFYSRFLGESNDNVYLGGMMYLKKTYPPRQAAYKRFKTLPPLYNQYGVGRFTSSND